MADVFDKQTLELTLRASNEGIWDWSIDSEEIYYSLRIKRFMGYGKAAPPNIMTHPEQIVHEDSIDFFQDLLSLTLLDSEAEHLSIDCKIRRPDGDTRWIRIRGIVIRNKGEAVRIAGSMIDISKRKFAEEMIAEERNMLRLIFDNIPLQVYFKDTESYYKLVNKRQMDWLGKSEISEIIGKSGESFFSPESWSASRKEELQIMQTGIPVIDAIQRETWPNKPDSYVQKVKHPWYDSSGNLLGTYGISCDVTTLIQAKKKLENLAINLQQQNKSYQEELMLAREVQRAILPENSPSWENTIKAWKDKLRINTLYVPASELAGDFYDVITISDQKIGFLIIDVMGHGVRSAIIASLIRGLMEQAEYLASEPALYLQKINAELTTILQKASTTLFATACYTLVDFESYKISFASAGHDFPIIKFSKEGTTRKINKTKKGPALGICDGAQYAETIYPLGDIKSILLFTDGIYEAGNEHDQEWGLKNLAEAFNKLEQPKFILDQIYNEATAWIGHGQFNDDVCLLNLEIV